MAFDSHHQLSSSEIDTLTKRLGALYTRRSGMEAPGSLRDLVESTPLAWDGGRRLRRILREVTGQPELWAVGYLESTRYLAGRTAA